jgi:hypothetical protein
LRNQNARRLTFVNVIICSLLSFPLLSLAQDTQVRVPFIFSEDEKLGQTDLNKSIPPGTDIQADAYLNAPMTRLEYMLTNLEVRLMDENTVSIVRNLLAETFEPLRAKPTVKGVARYQRDNGRIIVGYGISDVGKPKKPMHNSCDTLLILLQGSAPQRNKGYLLHSNVLGVLAQESLDKYTTSMATMAKSIVHRVVLNSRSEDDRITHTLSCQRAADGGPITYERTSYAVNIGR